MTTHLLSALKWLLRRASDISGSNEVIGADAMFPILISVLCHSEISSMHRILVNKLHFVELYFLIFTMSLPEFSFHIWSHGECWRSW